MTNREMLSAVINGIINEEVVLKAQEMLAAIDKRNEKRASTPSKTAIANEPIKAAIVDLLANGGKFANEVSKSLEISTQKASALLRQLVADHLADVVEVKVKGKGACKFYTLKVDEGPQYLDREVRA